MSDFPKFVHLTEMGPREGFQIESKNIPTDDKVRFIDALSETGVKRIQITAFVSPRWVPQMADADEVARRFTPRPGVTYTALALNERGRQRIKAYAGKLSLDEGPLTVWATDEFCRRNNNCTRLEQLEGLAGRAREAAAGGLKETAVRVGAAFGCNFHGEVPLAELMWVLEQQWRIWHEVGVKVTGCWLADTMGWANPLQIKRTIGAIRERWPEIVNWSLHLHDTRGLGMPNLYAALEMGVDRFDACCAGLGGCPYGGSGNAAGNVCTEDVGFMCREMGIGTDVDLEKMIECARLAEEVVGHVLPGHIYKGWPLPRVGTRWHALYSARPAGPVG